MRLTAFTAIVLSIAGCTTTDDAPQPGSLVIEGHIDSDGHPHVLLTSSITPSAEGGNMADNLIRWGKVTVSDGLSEVILTGGMTSDYFPPYHYYNHTMTGVPGRTYTITAEYDGLTASASCRMPEPTPIDDIEINPIEGNDTLRSLTMHITAPADCPAYYHITTRVMPRDTRDYPAMFGTFTASTPGEHLSIPVYRGKHATDTTDFVINMPVGTSVAVTLCRVEKPVYDFWIAYDNIIYFGGSQFISAPASLPGNVAGGYGIWSAQGTDHAVVTVR